MTMKLVLVLLPTVAAASGSGSGSAGASGGRPYAAFDSTAGTVQHGFLSIEGDGWCEYNGESGPNFRNAMHICSNAHKIAFHASLGYSDFCGNNSNGIFSGLTLSQAANKCKRHHHCKGFRHGTAKTNSYGLINGTTDTRFLAYPPTGRNTANAYSNFKEDFKCYQQVEGRTSANDEGYWMTVAIVAIVSIPVSMLGAMGCTGYLLKVLKRP